MQENLTTKGRIEALADRNTVLDVLYFLWACDTRDLGRNRNRLQPSLSNNALDTLLSYALKEKKDIAPEA